MVEADEAGPIERGSPDEADIRATLADMVTGRHGGRRAATEVTAFKSAGNAIQDLVAALLVVEADG